PVQPHFVTGGAVGDGPPGHSPVIDVQGDPAVVHGGRRDRLVVAGAAGQVGAVAHCRTDRQMHPLGTRDALRVAAGTHHPTAMVCGVVEVVHEGAGAGPCARDAHLAEESLPTSAAVPRTVEPDAVTGATDIDAAPRHAVGIGHVQHDPPAVRVPLGDRE